MAVVGKQRRSDGKARSEFVNFPTYIFRDRDVAVLEAMAEYLKQKHYLNYHEIAHLLNRDERTIWTVFHRAQLKRKQG